MAFRRPLRRRPGLRRGRVPKRAVPPVVRQALQRAQRMQEAMDFIGAAAIYARLAEEAYQRGRVRAGVQLGLEAGWMHLQAEHYSQAQEHALRALRALLAQKMPLNAVRSQVARICEFLEAKGEGSKAERFRQSVDSVLREHQLSYDTLPDVQVQRQETLPAHCPSCYAPLRPDEVEWLESNRAQCSYCGDVILAQ